MKKKIEERIKELEMEIKRDVANYNNLKNYLEQLERIIVSKRGGVIELRRLLDDVNKVSGKKDSSSSSKSK